MLRESIKIYWAAMRPRKWLWLAAFILHAIFFTLNDVIFPLVISRFVGSLSDIAGKTFSDFTIYLWLWAGLHLTQTVIGRVGIYTWFHVLVRTLMDIDLKSFSVTLSHGSDFFANNFTGSLVTKFNRFSRSFETLATATMFDLNALMVSIIFPFIILLFISPLIAFILLGWSIAFALSLIYLHKRKIPRTRRVAEYDSKITGAYADVVTNAMSVKMFARFPVEMSTFKNISLMKLKARWKNMIFGDFIRVYKMIIILILELCVVYFSVKFALGGTLSLPDVLLIQLYVRLLIDGLWNFGKLVEKLEEALADATEMTEIYNLPVSVKDVDNPKKLTNIKGRIVLDSVSFAYKDDNSDQYIFKELNLTIPKGQKVGLVGPSGGGKTTLTKLLLRFMDTESGKITFDDQDISKVSQDDLRSHIAYVPQEPLLFHRSIYENISYGDPEASEAEVLQAAKLAHADEFIRKLPDGYQTLVGERGIKLSGGQKQRIAIARAMLKKSPILLLDEATSALDSKSEKHISKALDNLMKDRTTLVIAHRLSTIRKLDRILVLSEGKIVEDGSHNALLKRKGLYHELWSHQQGDFLNDEEDIEP